MAITFVLALALALAPSSDQSTAQSAPPQAPQAAKPKSPEELAVERVQKLIVRTQDGSLPERTLQSWIREVFGASAGTTWELGDCGEQMGGPVVDRSRNQPTCVDVIVALGPKRDLHLVFFSDVVKPGARATAPKFNYGVVMEGGSSTRWLKSLGEANRVR